MSDAYIKKYETNHSAEKRKPAPEARHRGRNKRPRPFIIESRWTLPWKCLKESEPDWRTEGRYRTEEERDRALAQKLRSRYSDFIEYRIPEMK